MKIKNNSETTTLPSDKETIRGHRLESPLFESAEIISSEEINEILKPFMVKENNEEKSNIKNERKIIYSDDNWEIEIISNTDFNPIIKVSSFKDGHFVDDLELSRQMFEDVNMIDKIKDLSYL